MKNIFLTAVIISALTISGIGGTLAGFSDTEMSENNFFEMGSLDLKVDNGGTEEYDDPLPVMVQAAQVVPGLSQEFSFNMHSISEPEDRLAPAYIMFRDYFGYDVSSPEHPDAEPEPEKGVELGGKLAGKKLPALGEETASYLAKFVEVWLQFDTNGDGALESVLGNSDWGSAGTVYLSDLVDKWLDLGDMSANERHNGKITLHISSWSEEQWNARFGTNFSIFTDELPFNSWLTNQFMNDGVRFTIDFGLTQEPIPAAYLYP